MWAEIFILISVKEKTVNVLKWLSLFFVYLGTSATVERVFNEIMNVWHSKKGTAATGIEKSLLNIKYNSEYSCCLLYTSRCV